ncbi:MAG: DVUA0089 family protein [Spirochaetota bacterium]
MIATSHGSQDRASVRAAGTARPTVIAVALALIAMLAAATPLAAQSWDEVTDAARAVDYDGELGVASGEVADGFASFVFTAEEAGPVTVEVDVTDVRPGLEYEDEDSVLFLFDEDGRLLAENDDGPYGWASMLNGVEIPEPGTYYLVVTTHPRFAETDDVGMFAGFDEPGLSSIAFDLVVETGAREVDPPEPPDLAYTLDDVFSMGTPFEFTGEETVVRGSVDGDIAVFEIYLAGPVITDVEVVITEEISGGDSVLTVTDASGFIVAEDDDGGVDTASLTEAVPMTESEVYYAVVTGWPAYPEYGPDGRLQGFTSAGESAFEFDLVLREAAAGDAPKEPLGPPDAGERAGSFDEVRAGATLIEPDGDTGVGTGHVAAGYEAFEVEITRPVDMTFEVVTVSTGGRPEYASNSMLALFDAEGRLVASDDDGGVGNAAKIANVRLTDSGSYYAIVTTYPNEVMLDGDGKFAAVEPYGEGHLEFELVVTGE